MTEKMKTRNFAAFYSFFAFVLCATTGQIFRELGILGMLSLR